jgi:hypothetical protein
MRDLAGSRGLAGKPPLGAVRDSLQGALDGKWSPLMATKVEPARERLYDQDFYAWTRQQAAHLRARRFNALDLDHLVEAAPGVGDVQREAVLSNALGRARASPGARAHPRDGPEERLARDGARASRPARAPDHPPPPAGYVTSWSASTRSRAATPRARCATTASRLRPTSCPPPTPTPSTRSPLTGGRDADPLGLRPSSRHAVSA